MGYRFTLNTANTVANLSFGKVLSCYRGIMSDEEQYWGFRYFLEKFDDNFYSDYRNHKRSVHKILTLLQDRNKHNNYNNTFDDEYRNNMLLDRRLLELLGDLSDVLNRCRVKSLLLPRPYWNKKMYRDDFMTSKETLHHLLHWHPTDSCLILQPQERPDSKEIVIFDAFPNFDVALRQIESWPAVMFWDKNEKFVFIPVDHEKELVELYEIVHYERRNPLGEIRRISERKATKPSHYYFHLSDLHFGARNVPIAERRLRTLLDKHIATLNEQDDIGFIITGDSIDSPKKANKIAFTNFTDSIESMSKSEPIIVLGNHDVNTHGLAITSNHQSFAFVLGDFPKLKIDEKAGVLFLLLNSNTKGHLAEGEIGTQQLSEAGNLLDRVKNLNSYRIIVVLHHHVINIPEPNWRNQKWYKKILPKGFLEDSLRLRDADVFLSWLKKRNVKIVLHGHKHVPFVGEEEGVKIVACGSSTGQVTHVEKGKTYMSYNILKIDDNSIACVQYVEELSGAGALDINTLIIDHG